MRTTVARVRDIMDELDFLDPVVESYIGAANVFVTDRLGTSSLGDTMLEEIERWMTAHMIACTRARMSAEEEAGSAKVKYIGTYTDALNSTPYGQMVISLDSTGAMASIGKKLISIQAL